MEDEEGGRKYKEYVEAHRAIRRRVPVGHELVFKRGWGRRKNVRGRLGEGCGFVLPVVGEYYSTDSCSPK